MNLAELAHVDLISLSPDDSVVKAVNQMNELGLQQLPLIDQLIFKGFISDDQLLDSYAHHQSVGEFEPVLRECYITPQEHYYQALRVANEHKSEMIALVDERKSYYGIIFRDDIFKILSSSVPVQMEGGILVVSTDKQNYSLREVASLIESENITILSLWLEDHSENDARVILTIKTNSKDITKLEPLFEKFNYKIEGSFHRSERITNEQQRFDNLLKYLNI